MTKQKREYFRVTFPKAYNPSLEFDSDKYVIHDISEYGIKFKVIGDNPFMTNELLIADIEFPDGESFELSGQIVRIEPHYVSMELATPIPLSKIRAEHIHLIQQHLN